MCRINLCRAEVNLMNFELSPCLVSAYKVSYVEFICVQSLSPINTDDQYLNKNVFKVL